MKLDFKTIPHSEQRYPTVGDYWQDGDVWHFRVSEMGDAAYEFLVFVHELVEWFLYVVIGGKDALEIDAFDRAFEETREEGNVDEPGDDAEAPYHKEHMIATAIERIVSVVLGIDWHEYSYAVEHL